jgi:brefeldin A-inhibited guanine nucleotide-exchange protein
MSQFDMHINTFYPLVVDILTKEVAQDMRLAVRDYLRRVGEMKGFEVRKLVGIDGATEGGQD